MSKKHIVSLSFGKDSLAMLLLMIEKKMPIDEVVFYDTGKEFQAIYSTRDKVKVELEKLNIKYTELEPAMSFDYMMFDKPVKKRGTNVVHKNGYGWCGGVCRWGTSNKVQALEKHCKGHYVYIGLAADEQQRIAKERKGDKVFPLNEWGMTEKDCLEYCYAKGYIWDEDGIRLYDLLDRVSCWCCRNKNLKELRNIYLHLPCYWQRLKDTQSRLAAPMKGEGKSVFDLEKRFKHEEETKK